MSEHKNISKTEELKQKAVEQLGSVLPSPEEKNTFSFEELYEHKDEIQYFLIDDLIPDSEVFGIIGEDGIGKTQLMSQLALCIGMKLKHFLGLNLNTKHGNALIVATEDSKKKFTKAIMKIAHGIDSKLNPKSVGVFFTEGSNFNTFDQLVNEIERNLKLRKTDLVIVDALADAFNMIDGEINSNSHATKILSKFQHICNTYSCAVGFVHHTSKTSLTEKRKNGKMFIVKNDNLGAGRITSKPRTILALTHDPKSISQDSTTYKNYLHAVKVNLQSRHYMKNAIECTFDTNTLLHESDGMVDIELYESGAESGIDEPVKRKPMAKEISVEQHIANCSKAFGKETLLSRKDLVGKLKIYYGVGANKIEQSGGYLQYLLDQGLVVQQLNMYRRGEQSDIKLPIRVEPPAEFDNIVIKPNLDWDNTSLPDEETPF